MPRFKSSQRGIKAGPGSSSHWDSRQLLQRPERVQLGGLRDLPPCYQVHRGGWQDQPDQVPLLLRDLEQWYRGENGLARHHPRSVRSAGSCITVQPTRQERPAPGCPVQLEGVDIGSMRVVVGYTIPQPAKGLRLWRSGHPATFTAPSTCRKIKGTTAMFVLFFNCTCFMKKDL